MKNLLIFISPNKKFDKENSKLAKIQIDNSLDLGWKREDIIFVTNFPFEYNSVKSLIVPDDLYYSFDLGASKVPVIIYLIKEKLLSPTEPYWCHDLDACELNKITESELELNNFDLGLIHYFYKQEWSFGSFFFRTSAIDILELIDSESRAHPHSSRNNEKTLTRLIRENKINEKRFKKLNVTYNIMKRSLRTIYKEATKPIKVLHFLPSNHDILMPDTALNMFMYGKNSLKIPLMNERLIKIFKYHGIK